MMNQYAKALFISHGGGPLPLLGDPTHEEMITTLKQIADTIPKPKAIVIVSAHWETSSPAITASASPALIYDYYGFPEESYSLQYPAQGDPELAKALHTSLKDAGFSPKLDSQRGYDHGVFVPLTIMYPDADIPCIQISLLNSLDPQQHIALGQAISQCQQEGLLVLGSGFSFHNMRAFFAAPTDESMQLNQAFESWLIETCSDKALSESTRSQRLVSWADARGARYCHPREEHLLPLHVCYGVAQSVCSSTYELTILNKKSSMYLW
jgi:aromatic ring-opening dioxygenase catalytic subunit (LigB family)